MPTSCNFKVGEMECGLKVEMFRRGMMATANQLTVRDSNGSVHVVYLCAEHAARLLAEATGDGPPTSG